MLAPRAARLAVEGAEDDVERTHRSGGRVFPAKVHAAVPSSVCAPVTLGGTDRWWGRGPLAPVGQMRPLAVAEGARPA